LFELSAGTTVIWQIAAGEAADARHEFIEPEHIFIGTCKAGDLPAPELFHRLGIKPADMEKIRIELNPVNAIFQALGLSRIEVCNYLGDLMEPGEYEHEEGIIHRSAECTHLFGEASRICLYYNNARIQPVHVLAAILDNPEEKILGTLSHFNVDIADLKEKVTRELGKKKARVAKKTGKFLF
jgi:ATP-dependent Clp protease ATP-binding subunit ClpA